MIRKLIFRIFYYLFNRYQCKSKLLTILGDLEVSKYPMWIFYKAQSYKIKGKHIRKILSLVRDGDVILRGYDGYLDGYFIPGKYTHSGIYVGRGKVIHAIAEGVQSIDIIDYVRCDRVLILRPKVVKLAISRAKKWLGHPYDFDFTSGNDKFYCHELVCEAFRELNPEKLDITLFGVKIPFMEPRYLGDSLIRSKSFKKVYSAG